MRSLTLVASVVFVAAAVFAAPTSPSSPTRHPLVKRAGSLTPEAGGIKPVLSSDDLKLLVSTTSKVVPDTLHQYPFENVDGDIESKIMNMKCKAKYKYTKVAFNKASINKHTTFNLNNGDIDFKVGLDLEIVADYHFDLKFLWNTKTCKGQMCVAIEDALVCGTLSVPEGDIVGAVQNIEAKIDKFKIEMDDNWLSEHVGNYIRTTEKMNYETQLSDIVGPSVSSIVNEVLTKPESSGIIGPS